MYIALGIMIAAMLLGRLFQKFIPQKLIHHLIMCAIWLLLFLLGVSIGANDSLLERLPELGWQAFILTLFCVAGSIACVLAIGPLLNGKKGKEGQD